jgi:hypothetical protein
MTAAQDGAEDRLALGFSPFLIRTSVTCVGGSA